MKDKINYSLSTKKDKADNTKLKCIINEDKKVIFEFTYELLSHENFQNLNEKSSADDFYKAIEKFLDRQLDSNSLEDIYHIRSDNFWQYNN